MARKVLADLDFGSVARITNLPDAQAAQEPATLGQLNAVKENLAWKDDVRVASTANVNIASPGATIDGIALSNGDRVLLKDQTTASENGIYIWNGATVPMTRAMDAQAGADFNSAVVGVDEGTVNGGSTWRQTQTGINVGTTAILWTSFGSATPDATTSTKGKAQLATQADVDAGADTTKIVTPATLSNWAGRLRKAAATIGDGSATQIDVSHNLNTRDVHVEIRYNSGNYDFVDCAVSLPDANTARLNFAAAPAANSLRVIVIG
jgi:hypothetical protein